MDHFMLSGSDLLSDAKSKFNNRFPFLKIEFFSKKHKENKESWSKFLINNLDQKINDVCNLENPGTLNVRSQMTVSDFEQHFQELFGFGVQVFRKSKNTWMETTKTDDWVLEYQNYKGKLYSTTESHMDFENS